MWQQIEWQKSMLENLGKRKEQLEQENTRLKSQNGEIRPRDWLAWSDKQQALFCFPCRLFSSAIHSHSAKSCLASKDGWPKSKGWKKLYNILHEHQSSSHHSACYAKWRMLQFSQKQAVGIDDQLQLNMSSNIAKWTAILERILHVVLFLAERGLAFRSESNSITMAGNVGAVGFV